MSEPEQVQAPSAATSGWWQADSVSLVDTLQDHEETIRRLQAEQYAMLAELRARGTMADLGYPNVEALQVDALNVSRKEAKARGKRAAVLHPTRGVGSTMVPAVAPATAAAAADGAIGAEHIDTILAVHRRIPKDVPADEWDGYEKTLADLARATGPRSLQQVGRELIAMLDQDGDGPGGEDDPAHPDRDLQLGWRRDGHLGLKGYLDPETGKALQAILSPFTKPRPAADGTPDLRTTGERNGDALAEIIDKVQRDGDLPTEAGAKPTVTVVLDYNKLLDGLSTVGALGIDLPITAEQARRLSCDADVIPAVLGTNGEVLDLGRSQRLITPAQRRALNLRDKGCIFPGCTRPPQWCQGHHIKHWLQNGPSDLANLCLLCTEHHRLIHHSDWEIVMAADGHPECIPPPFIDPQRRPRRNHTHHPLE